MVQTHVWARLQKNNPNKNATTIDSKTACHLTRPGLNHYRLSLLFCPLKSYNSLKRLLKSEGSQLWRSIISSLPYDFIFTQSIINLKKNSTTKFKLWGILLCCYLRILRFLRIHNYWKATFQLFVSILSMHHYWHLTCCKELVNQ